MSPKNRILMNAFFKSQFKYCPLIWMCDNRSLSNKINQLHDQASIYLLKVSNRDKINIKETRATPMASFTNFTPCSSVSVVNFEHVTAGWGAMQIVYKRWKIKFWRPSQKRWFCFYWPSKYQISSNCNLSSFQMYMSSNCERDFSV